MPKCDFCGEEALFVFRCSHCNRVFCAKHRLPESHDCKELASDHPPLSPPDIRESTVTTNTRALDGKRFMCPNCGNLEKRVFDYDLKTMTFKCHECGYKWTLMKSTYELVMSNETHEETETTTSEPSDAEPIDETAPSETSEEPTTGNDDEHGKSGRRFPTRKLIGVVLGIVLIIAFLWFSPSLTILINNLSSPKNYSYEELVDYSLHLINSNRNGLVTNANGTMLWIQIIGERYPQNVSLSLIGSAQQHADEMLRNHYFSHWDTDGYKPYMRYTSFGGNGKVAENIAWQHSSSSFDMKEGIENLEWSMMEEDSQSNWGHRDNIIDASHNKVSIGIAYDSNNLYLVEDFEDDYVAWLSLTHSGTEVVMDGTITKSDLLISHVAIYYDKLSNLTTQQLADAPYKGSYDSGTFVGMAVPSGWESPQGITITARTWSQIGQNFQIDFDISPAFAQFGKGVYTLYLITKSSNFLTSFSVWN